MSNFDLVKLGKMKSIVISDSHNSTIEISYAKLKLIVVNNQLCFYYSSDEGDLYMPIARKNTIDKLFGDEK